MALALPPEFELSEASPYDLVEAFLVFIYAFKTDTFHEVILKDVKPEEIHPYVVAHLLPRWTLPDITVSIIKEVASGKIVAWAGLQIPWKYKPEMTPELIAAATSEELPPPAEGMNMEAVAEMFRLYACTVEYGYDPVQDYHRKNTAVLPEYQKRRLGSILTQHLNEIQDKTGDKAWVQMRPASVRMFKKYGFKEVGVHHSHLERWGGDEEKSKTKIAVRDSASA